jgi:hypothetical protein
MVKLIYLKKTVYFFGLILLTSIVVGQCEPTLHFSDIVSGPKTGNTDGQATDHGSMVTIWGNNLGSSQGNSKVYFRDFQNNIHEAAHIYYWTDANGQEGGPADLYTSHKMQEIAFSIPSTATDGLGKIYVEINGQNSNELNFTVRDGNIYFVKPALDGGDDSNNGLWNSPWEDLQNTVDRVQEGDIIYAYDITQVGSAGVLIIRGVSGSLDNPIALITYPGSKTTLTATNVGYAWGIANHNKVEEHWVFSKLTVRADGQPISAFNYLRAIGNDLSDQNCAESQAGVFSTSEWNCNKNIMFGNYIHDFGCGSTSNLQHTTYFSNRHFSGQDNNCEAFDFGWNYLTNNEARAGIHIYDEGWCGSWDGIVKIHDNVIENQVGAGIDFNVGCSVGWEMEIYAHVYNNIFVNAGLAQSDGDQNCPAVVLQTWQASSDAGLEGFVKFYNNIFYGFGEPSSTETGDRVFLMARNLHSLGNNFDFYWLNNIVVDTNDFEYFYNPGVQYWVDPIISSNNIWYSLGDQSSPSWDTNAINSNPLFVDPQNLDFSLQDGSPAYGAASDGGDIGATKCFNENREPSNDNVLLECNWDNGIGTSFDSVTSGVYTHADSSGNFFEVVADDGTVPGGRNFLRIYDPSSGSAWIRGHPSFNSPSTVFIRYWWRIPSSTPMFNRHNMILYEDSQAHNGDGGIGFWPRMGISDEPNGLTSSIDFGDEFGSWRLGPYENGHWRTIERDTWYQMEFKIIDGSGATDSLEVRIDGIDVTNDYVYYGDYMYTYNGAMDINSNGLNFFSIGTYDKSTSKDTAEDIAGLKITIGPDWIGGNETECENRVHFADNNPCDGCIDDDELLVSIDSWLTGNLFIADFLKVVELWKNGCDV